MRTTVAALAGHNAASRALETALRFCSGALLLLAGLYGALLSFFQTFSLPEAQTALLWALPTALLFLAFFLLPKHRGVAYLVAFLIWGIAAFFVLRQVVTGAVFAAEQFSTQAAAVFPKLGHFTPPQSQAELAACRMFFRVAQFPLTGYLAWAVVKARSFFFSFLGTAPFLAAAAAVGQLPPVLPLVLLVGFWAAMLLSGRAGKGGKGQAARAGLLLAPFAFLLTMLVLLASPPDAYQPSASVTQARNTVIQAISELLGINRQSGPSNGLGAPMAGSPGSTDLTNAGELHFTGRTALKVRMDQPQDIYLRGWAGAVYTGTSWQVVSDAAYQSMGVAFQPLLYADISRRNLGSGDETTTASTITVEPIGANGFYTYMPYQFSQVPSDPLVVGSDFVHDSYLQIGRGEASARSYTLAFYRPLSDTLQARITSRVRQMERGYEEWIAKSYTQLPDGVSDRLLAFAAKTGLPTAEGPADWLAVAQAVAGAVADAGTYTERPGAVPVGEDFVTYFLEQQPQGYCVHFASAAAALMRALNVPARYVEGYTVKTSNFKADVSAEIPDRQAHAWVEIWADGLGWTPIEATPGGAATLRENPDANREPSETAPSPAPATDAPAAEQNDAAVRWGAPLLTGLLLIALAAIRLELARRRKRAFCQTNRNQAALAVYAYLCRLSRFGYTLSGTAQQLARKAKFSRHMLTQEELSALRAEAEQGAKSTYAGLPIWKKLFFRLLVF